MFTGLVEALGDITAVVPDGAGRLLEIRQPDLMSDLSLGASVAINGVCLTVMGHAGDRFRVEAGPETLSLTNLGELQTGARVNLERAMKLGDRLGGHIVPGHVDGVGRLENRQVQGAWELLWFSCPAPMTKQMVRKGSIAVDGVSLTLVEVSANGFSVALIPHTLAQTTLGFKKPGESVNLETDLFAKYVGRYLETAMAEKT